MTEQKEFDVDLKINVIANRTAKTYPTWTTPNDIRQELHLYIRDGGKKHIQKAIENGDHYRVDKLLYGAAKRYAETEKAARSGYSFEDVAWYSPEKLADLVPLAVDPGWDGLTGEGDETSGRGSVDGREGGTLLAMIADIRRFVPAGDSRSFDPLTEAGLANLCWLAERLGGEFPESPGYGRGRRAVNTRSEQ